MSIKAIRWAFGAIAEHQLPVPQRLALLSLAYHHHADTGACFPTFKTISADTGLSKRAVIAAIQGLDTTGLIEINARSVHGRQRSNQYDLFGKFKAPRGVHAAAPLKRNRGVHMTTPLTLTSGVHAAAPDKVIIYIPEPGDENLAPFSLTKGCGFSGGAN